MICRDTIPDIFGDTNGKGDVLQNELDVKSNEPHESCAVFREGRPLWRTMEGGGTDLETPVEWGVQWRHFAPIRVQIIRVELGRIESQLCQNLGFLKPKVVGSNPTTFTVFIFRTLSDPRVHSAECFGVGTMLRRIRHSRQMLR